MRFDCKNESLMRDRYGTKLTEKHTILISSGVIHICILNAKEVDTC